MLCVVDIGNTNIVIALMKSSEQVCFSGRIITERNKKKDKFMQEVQEIFNKAAVGLSNIEGVIISSVVPEITEVVRSGMAELTGLSVLVMGTQMVTGLSIKMDNPDKVGSDLLVDAVAASEEYGENVVIFDLGTATTCSLVKNGMYLGTIIIPGVGISQAALSDKAAQLPCISLEQVEENEVHLMGKNTIESMMSGILHGNAAMIDGLIERIEEEEQCNVTVVATGGIAKAIVPYCKKKIILDNNLLLKGLWYIFQKNTK